MSKNLFILGCPRSGTTLLSNLLTDTDFGAPIETHFITKYYKKLPSYGNLNDRQNFTRLIRDILNERPVKQWRLQVSPEHFFSELKEYTFSKIVNELCLKRSRLIGKRYWGDKTPHYILEVEILYKLFPYAKFIYIVRDGRDVALSLLKKPWGPSNIFSCAEYWRDCNTWNSTLEILKTNKQLITIKYEDLITQPEQIIINIFNFLEQQYDHVKIHKTISNINCVNSNKWKTKMSRRQIKLFENICADILIMHNYKTSYQKKKINLFIFFWYKLLTYAQRIKFLFVHNIIDGALIKFCNKEPFAE